MKNIFIVIIIILFNQCNNSSTSPNTTEIEYYLDDLNFIEQLSSLNGISQEILSNFITSVIYKVDNSEFYRLNKLYLNNLGISLLPDNIGELDSLKVLKLDNNSLTQIPNSICNIYNQLDTLLLENNDICTPSVPECILNSTTVSLFYSNQQCEIIPWENDQEFISDLIVENWGEDASTSIKDELDNLTTWENFIQGDDVVSRITEIRYNNKGIQKIPNTISNLDSLQRIELQYNQIDTIPGYVSNLSRLNYFTIQNNNITFLPPQIRDLKKLEIFKISENKLTEVHQNIGQLTNLIVLHLSENELESLPDSMCNILSNSSIDINIDNNKICSNYNECFIDLIENSTQDCP
tara:strand:+ start:8106 stop:9158 length:1053 start_codon:yes stop_codon:yes gene_type:complete